MRKQRKEGELRMISWLIKQQRRVTTTVIREGGWQAAQTLGCYTVELAVTQTIGWQEGRRKAKGVEYDFLRQAVQILGCYKVELAVTQSIGW